MFINSDELNKAVDHISLVASMDKAQPGILFDIMDDSIEVYYNTQQKAIKKTISAVVEPDETHGKVIFDYKRFIDTISTCKSSGDIKVGDIELTLATNANMTSAGGSGIATLRVVKTMEMATGPDTVEDKVVSTTSHELSWWLPNDLSTKQKILTQPACDDMFKEVDAESWDKDELCKSFADVSTGDAKVVYVTSKYEGMFAANTNSLVYVKTKTAPGRVMQLQTSCVKALIGIFNSIDSDEVMVNTINGADGKLFACLFFTPDHKTSVYLAATTLISAQVSGLARYHEISYTSYQASMVNSVVKDILKSAVSLSASTKGTIKFAPAEDGGVDAVIVAENTGASVSNTYNIRCTAFNSGTPIDEHETLIFSLSTDLKLLLDIVNSNKLGYVGFDIFKDEKRAYLRVGFFSQEDSYEVTKAMIEAKKQVQESNGIEGPIVLDESDKMDIRDDYISTCYYITANV